MVQINQKRTIISRIPYLCFDLLDQSGFAQTVQQLACSGLCCYVAATKNHKTEKIRRSGNASRNLSSSSYSFPGRTRLRYWANSVVQQYFTLWRYKKSRIYIRYDLDDREKLPIYLDPHSEAHHLHILKRTTYRMKRYQCNFLHDRGIPVIISMIKSKRKSESWWPWRTPILMINSSERSL